MIQYELQQSIPRPTRRRAGHGWFIGCVHLFILPHCLGGMLLLFAAMLALVTTVLNPLIGEDAAGEVTGGDGSEVSYAYEIHGKKYHSSATTGIRLQKGTAVKVRFLSVCPELSPQLLALVRPSPWGNVALVWFFTVCWNGILLAVLWELYVRPWQLRGLVCRGMPTLGKIVSKEEIQGRGGKTYHVHYEYVAPEIEAGGLLSGDGETRKGSMKVRDEDFDAAIIGAEETVLYEPKRPSLSLLYRFAAYEAVPR